MSFKGMVPPPKTPREAAERDRDGLLRDKQEVEGRIVRRKAGRRELLDRLEYHATAHPDMPVKEQIAFIRASDAEQDRQIAEGDGWRATLDKL